jgi:hypothetical protein
MDKKPTIDFRSVIERNGPLLEESSEALTSVIAACTATGKKGSVSVSFQIEPQSTRDGGPMVKIIPKVESKNPRFDAGVSLFHVVTDADGNPVELAIDDPKQMSFFVNAVKSTEGAQ